MLRQVKKLQDVALYEDSSINNQADGSLESRKPSGAVYTPTILADYVAQKVTELYVSDQDLAFNLNELRVLDPACGKGELLISIWNKLVGIFPSDKRYANNVLCGIDIDNLAVSRTRVRIRQLVEPDAPVTRSTKLINTNSLFPFNSKNSKLGWNIVKRRFDAESGFDIIIANPPWGANLSSCSNRLSQAEFSMYMGQCDSSDLFLESAISNLREGGYLAFIIPDSLFSQERKALRKLLLDKTEIRFIGRLGEKFFGGVNRACAVVICRKTAEKVKRKICCFRLTPETRKEILAGTLNFNAAEQQLSHFVRHSRFEENSGYKFDIDLSTNEEVALSRILTSGKFFREHIFGTRGVELSKNGKVYECPTCRMWAPFPSSEQSICQHCKNGFSRGEVFSTNIVSKERKKKFQPIIVGESIRRNVINGRYWIDTSKKGINYKNSDIYKSPKIVIRKTGVGISAAIDYRNSLTNQVVYIFKPVIGNNIPLEFYLGVLSSRAIYYYIVKSHGETEWRSHPYVTQKQILNIPMHSISQLQTKHADQVERIVSTVRSATQTNKSMKNEADAIIEKSVAKLYGLTKSDYEIIFQTINSSQDLLPVRALKHIDINKIFDV